MTISSCIQAAAISLVFLSGICSADDCENYAQAGFKIIREADIFSMDPLGEAALTPAEQIALRCLLRRPDAHAQFLAMYHHAKPAGKLFAAMGLSLLGSHKAEGIMQALGSDQTPVRWGMGCIIQEQRISSLVELLQTQGPQRLLSPRQDVPENLNFTLRELRQSRASVAH